MIGKPVFYQMESILNYSELHSGMYAVNCPGKFNNEDVESSMKCIAASNDHGFLNASFVGTMLPYYLHNANNLMVGVLGNLDLAGMFMPNIEKVTPKIAGARAATGSVVDYLRDIAGAIPPSQCVSFNEDVIKKCLTLLKAACGRSVNFTGLDEIDTTIPFLCKSPSNAVAVLNGMAAWVIVSLSGSGTLIGYSSPERLGLKWKRPEGAGLSYMPGTDSALSILVTAGGLAAAAGLSLVVENWTENSGEVYLVVR